MLRPPSRARTSARLRCAAPRPRTRGPCPSRCARSSCIRPCPGRTRPTSAPACRRVQARSSPHHAGTGGPGSASAVVLLAVDPRDELVDVAGAEALDVGVGPLPDLLVTEAAGGELLARVVLEYPCALERTQLVGLGLGDARITGAFGDRGRIVFGHAPAVPDRAGSDAFRWVGASGTPRG